VYAPGSDIAFNQRVPSAFWIEHRAEFGPKGQHYDRT
jgi:hypothetical protein